jgi:hypothetical protein
MTLVDASCLGSTRASRAATPLLSTANTVPESADPRVEPYKSHTSEPGWGSVARGRLTVTSHGSVAGRDRGWRRIEIGPGEASKGLTQIKQGI